MQCEARPSALIVEDEVLLALLVEDLLAAEGFETAIATTEAEVHASAAALGRITVAVVNLRLGGTLTGQQVIRSLRQHVPNLPVVVITGFDGRAPQANLRGLGWPTMRLSKPGDYPQLAAAVWNVIDQGRKGKRPQLGRRRTEKLSPP